MKRHGKHSAKRQLAWTGFALILTLFASSAVAGNSAEAISGVEPEEFIGTGDGRIHIIPSLSSPSVKDGGELTIQAVIKAATGVADVSATIHKESGNGENAPVASLVLSPAGTDLGGTTSDSTLGIWQTKWTATGLQDAYYRVAITVKDRNGHEYTDRSLRFSDPIAGRDTVGTSDYPDGGMIRVDAADDFRDEARLISAVVDTVNGYAYFGGSGQVVKIALGSGSEPPSRIGMTNLDPGEYNLTCAVIDPSAGYAYFGTSTSPGRVVKVALGSGSNPPVRIGAIVLNTGEDKLASAVIDPSAGYAYFGTRLSVGRVIKVALGSGSNPPTRVGAVELNPGEYHLTSAVIDPSGGYAYFGSNTSPGRVVKVALGSGSNPPTRVGAVVLNTGEDKLTSAVIDPSGGYAYFGTDTSPGRVVKVALGSGSNPPARTGAVILESLEDSLTSGVIDIVAGYAFFGTDTSPGRVVKVALGNNADPPVRVGEVQLESEENQLTCAVFDTVNRYAYFGTNTATGQVVKIFPGDDMDPPVRIDVLALDAGETLFKCGAIDVPNGYAYFGTETGMVVKVALGNGSNPPSRTGSLLLSKEGGVSSAVIDPSAGFAYFAIDTYPARVAKVALGVGSDPPTYIGSAMMNSGENGLICAVIDPSAGYAYFGTLATPGQVVKVALGEGMSQPIRIGAVTLNPGEDYLYSAVIDAAAGYAYFGTDTSPGQVVKVALGDGSEPPERISAVTLDPGEDTLTCAGIDAENGYAYFGTFTAVAPGKVIKVALGTGTEPPTRIGAVTLLGAEIRLRSAVIDPDNGYMYFGTDLSSGRIIKIALGDGSDPPTRIGAVTLDEGEDKLFCGVIDPVHGSAYFGTYDSPGSVVRSGLSQAGFIKGSRFTMPEDGILSDARFYSHRASGTIRLAIYDNATPPNRLWQSEPIANMADEDWITEPIADGTPASLQLTAGDYWLAWQVDTMIPVASYAWGTEGHGFHVPQSWSEFPAVLNPEAGAGMTLTDDIWSGYVIYDALPPTPSPTPDTCLSTGVTISMPSNLFRAGDPCNCRVSVCNSEDQILNGYPLFVILDVFGDYFFAPSFNQIYDDYQELYPLFPVGETLVTVLPDFAWPDGVGAVNGILWYAALTDPSISQIVGEWDQWEFGWE